jgi:hypothetical protein
MKDIVNKLLVMDTLCLLNDSEITVDYLQHVYEQLGIITELEDGRITGFAIIY